MLPLATFLNHGILPFVGRRSEAERLHSFWSGTVDAHGLRMALLLGEAGTGKSRLVEEVIGRIAESGGIVIHTKLYPESTTSLVPLIAQALARAGGATGLLRADTDEDLASVVAALRRLARLRQTLLVIEDVHLLTRESVRDVAALLEAASDEPLSILCSARPFELTARGVLERYLVEEIELRGLGDEDVAALWRNLFGADAEPGLLRLLQDVTLGNILALRSALRGALKAGALARDASDRWRMQLSSSLREILERNVELLSEGMVAHLNDAEIDAALRLAALGEVFAREAAEEVLPGGDRSIEALIDKGVLGHSRVPAFAITAEASRQPLLIFTHTLLHRYLVHRTPVDRNTLIGIVARSLPLYSTLPLQLLASDTPLTAPVEEIKLSIIRMLVIIRTLHSTPDWEMGVRLLVVVQSIYDVVGEWSELDRYELEAEILFTKVTLLGRTQQGEFEESVDRLMELTTTIPSRDMAQYRLTALTAKVLLETRRDYQQCIVTVEETAALVEEYPELRVQEAYVAFLRSVVIAARSVSDMPMINKVYDLLRELLDHPETMSPVRVRALRVVAPYMLDIFTSKAELEDRLELMARSEEVVGRTDLAFPWNKAIFLYEVGEAEHALRLLDDIEIRFRDRGMIRTAIQSAILRICCRIALGGSLVEAESDIRAIWKSALPDHLPMIARSISNHVVGSALLRGKKEWGSRMYGEFSPHAPNIPLDAVEIYALYAGMERRTDLASLAARISSEESDPLQRLVVAVSAERIDGDLVEAAVIAVTETPILRLEQLVAMTATLALLHAADADEPASKLPARLHDRVASYSTEILSWMVERGLLHLIAPFLALAKPYLSKSVIERYAKLLPVRVEESSAGAERARLSMLGTIELLRPDGEVVRPRGARLRILLGLMVADRMLENPLTNREFYTIAAGEEEIERARNTVYAAMHRLREAVRHNILQSSGEKPGLNLDAVSVDLLEAHALLAEAVAAARDEGWARASMALVAALDITKGEVPFPTLYDNFFEAAREDFEQSLRTAVIRVVRGLLREGDPASAEEVLRRAVQGMPEDEELIELLCRALTLLGKRAEVERVKMRRFEVSSV